MSIFYLSTSNHILNSSTDYNNNIQVSLITPFYNWISKLGYNWIYSTIICDDKRYTQICLSDKGSICCIYIDKLDDNDVYYPFGLKDYSSFNNDVNKAAEFFFKNNQNLVSSKYEKVANTYLLFSDKIIQIIDYLPSTITKEYIRHVHMVLEEFLDLQNKLKFTREMYYSNRAIMTQSQTNLIKMIRQRDEERKTLSKIIKDTDEIINSNII
jgi:hypothetical protein